MTIIAHQEHRKKAAMAPSGTIESTVLDQILRQSHQVPQESLNWSDGSIINTAQAPATLLQPGLLQMSSTQPPWQAQIPYALPRFEHVPPISSVAPRRTAMLSPHQSSDTIGSRTIGFEGRALSRYQQIPAQLTSSARRGISTMNNGVTLMTTNLIDRPRALVSKKSVQALSQGAALCDRISSKLDSVITNIDEGIFSGREHDLLIYPDVSPVEAVDFSAATLHPDINFERSAGFVERAAESNKGSNFFAKVWLYSNSHLPQHLPPFKVYMPTFPLLCLAANYSDRVYELKAARKSELEAHVPADWRSGTKAMILKALPVDDINAIVFAIRGSQTFMDWAVNYRSEPTSPEGFLDDPGNLCHAGFLHVARKMVKPVAERLRLLIQENPARSNASLLITGHSAGGAVASLLYAHMTSTQVQSDLSYLTGFFKRVHCVTFGAPPISLLPLQKNNDRQHRKSLFYSFINEGDPVPRADKAVVKDLLRLYSNPAPTSRIGGLGSCSKLDLSSKNESEITMQHSLAKAAKPSKMRLRLKPSKISMQTIPAISATPRPAWPIVPCSLCPAGRLIVLRSKPWGEENDIEAVTVSDELLRTVVFGDPLKHTMAMYRKRIETLATRAATAGGY